MGQESFYTLYCERFQCSSQGFEAHVLRQCLHPRAIILSNLIWRVSPEYFREDLELIREIKDLTDAKEVETEIYNFRNRHPPKGVLSGKLGVRISGQKLVNLAESLFGKGVIIHTQKLPE